MAKFNDLPSEIRQLIFQLLMGETEISRLSTINFIGGWLPCNSLKRQREYAGRRPINLYILRVCKMWYVEAYGLQFQPEDTWVVPKKNSIEFVPSVLQTLHLPFSTKEDLDGMTGAPDYVDEDSRGLYKGTDRYEHFYYARKVEMELAPLVIQRFGSPPNRCVDSSFPGGTGKEVIEAIIDHYSSLVFEPFVSSVAELFTNVELLIFKPNHTIWNSRDFDITEELNNAVSIGIAKLVCSLPKLKLVEWWCCGCYHDQDMRLLTENILSEALDPKYPRVSAPSRDIERCFGTSLMHRLFRGWKIR